MTPLRQGASGGRVFLRKEICRALGTVPASNLQEPTTALVIALGDQTMHAMSTLRSANSSELSAVWPKISQVLVTVEVCARALPSDVHASHARDSASAGSGDLSHARMLADLQALFELQYMQPFSSTRQARALRSPKLAPGLYPAGFPDVICRYRISLARHSDVAGHHASRLARTEEADLQRAGRRHGMHMRTDVRRQDTRVRLLGQMHVCSSDAAMFLTMSNFSTPKGVAGVGWWLGGAAHFLQFPGRDQVSGVTSQIVAGSATCHAACLEHPACRSWSYWDPQFSPIGNGNCGDGGGGDCGVHVWPELGVCVGCREGSWQPVTHSGTATGIVLSRFMKDGDKEAGSGGGGSQQDQHIHGREPFFLNVEPKGGWTMTDLVGFPFGSDAAMLHFLWPPPPSTFATAASITGSSSRGDAGPARDWQGRQRQAPTQDSKRDGVWDSAGGGGHEVVLECSNKPRAAVVYLVGPREEDLEALEESIASLESLFLLPHGNCYPIFFFCESWDGAAAGKGGLRGGARSRILAAASHTRTRAQMEFLIADMSFPTGFDASRHSSLQVCFAHESCCTYQ